MKVCKVARKVLNKYNENCITCYSCGITDDIFNEINPGVDKHPLDKSNWVINAIDRECKKEGALFEKSYINIFNKKVRIFRLINK